ncbi:MAG: imidazoleglycerol-phosphate dehydratase HisB [Nitrospirae bacterium]|nr:imidazoleglycerol-phosphate dehydratase HisB [Nitrospirota bacterium]
MARKASVERRTKETFLRGSLDLDGTGVSHILTGIPFLDHMLDQLSRHGLFDITLEAKGDLEIDLHHTVEDAGLVLGELFDQALGNRNGVHRFGQARVPLDETLAETVVDLSGRPFLVHEFPFERGERIGAFDPDLIQDFLQAWVTRSRTTLHTRVIYGRNLHHKSEALFKSLARALREATTVDHRRSGVPSTKGTLEA